MLRELNWRVLLLGLLLSAFGVVATIFITLKLGMSSDLSYPAMFLIAAVFGKKMTGRQLAIQMNLVQTMVSAATGVGFMCVILAAFQYIHTTFERKDVLFDPAWWQIGIWVTVSAYLGVFMGALPRKSLLDDLELEWPSAVAATEVITVLSAEQAQAAAASQAQQKQTLFTTTWVTGVLVFLKDGLGVITPMVGNASLKLMFSLEFAAVGLGMLVPLQVGLSYLVGTWGIAAFGDYVAKLAALRGVTPEYYEQCSQHLAMFADLDPAKQAAATKFLTDHCEKGASWLTNGHFALAVQWFMWPATAMMVTAALTGVLVPLGRNLWRRRTQTAAPTEIREEEHIPMSWIVVGSAVCTGLLVWIQSSWFDMSVGQVLFAVAFQPLLIVAGLRVLAITGQGPVSLVANAMQGIFGIVWPASISHNLIAAHVAADPQASAEASIVSYKVARTVGGRFTSLIAVQLLALPVCAFVLAPAFSMLVEYYGFGANGLSAPTGLKIAALAIVMEKGVSALPHGALTASIIGAVLGIVLELLLMVRTEDKKGVRFWWLPIPSVMGFALILPPVLTIPMALGSVIAVAWKRLSPAAYTIRGVPIAAGLIAGEALMASVLLPVLGTIMNLLKPLLQ